MYLLLLGFENDSGQVSRYLARYVVVSRTNSAAKRLELKFGISHVCYLSTLVPRRTLHPTFK